MTGIAQEETRGLYRLPWRNTDTPQCFLEITLECAARCPSCYQRDVLGSGHKPLAIVQRDVDVLVNAVNPGAVCIVGGEPLEHPEIEAVVRYVADRRVLPVLFSNVLALTPARLGALAEAGLKAVYGHIDRQTRRGGEDGVAVAREAFARLLRPFRGRLYGMLGAIVGGDRIEDAAEAHAWARANRDIIKYCILTLDGHKAGRPGPEVSDAVAAIRGRDPAFGLNTWLGGVETDRIHWGQCFCIGNRPVLPGFVRLINTLYRRLAGRYVSILPPGAFRVADFFTTVIVRPHCKGTVDFCEACPDQTVVWGRSRGRLQPIVVHSCMTPAILMSGRLPPEERALTAFLAEHPERATRTRNPLGWDMDSGALAVESAYVRDDR